MLKSRAFYLRDPAFNCIARRHYSFSGVRRHAGTWGGLVRSLIYLKDMTLAFY